MWFADYSQRLSSWTGLRQSCRDIPLASALSAINQWWHQTPWKPYYLHWDDRRDWPDPWQLLADNVYCDVARALGICYTISLLERQDCSDVQMVQANLGNLVLVQERKYIMNWEKDVVVNISSQDIQIHAILEPGVLEILIG